jgi:hypothetical protein
MVMFWVVMLYGLVGKREEHIALSPHGVSTQKTTIDIFAAVRISDLITCKVDSEESLVSERCN